MDSWAFSNFHPVYLEDHSFTQNSMLITEEFLDCSLVSVPTEIPYFGCVVVMGIAIVQLILPMSHRFEMKAIINSRRTHLICL